MAGVRSEAGKNWLFATLHLGIQSGNPAFGVRKTISEIEEHLPVNQGAAKYTVQASVSAWRMDKTSR